MSVEFYKDDNVQQWTLNGFLHRDDGPAVIDTKGDLGYRTEKWYQHGKLHRNNNLPAYVQFDKDLKVRIQMWYVDGKLHNDSGPAVVNQESKSWYINDVLHRDDGPAVVNYSGNNEYYQHGILHRDDGPAVVGNEYEKWYCQGKLHRIDGPAVIHRNGHVEWWLNNEKVTEEDVEQYKIKLAPVNIWSIEHDVKYIREDLYLDLFKKLEKTKELTQKLIDNLD